MSKKFDVIVIGVGSMGSATCYHLARRGLNVLGLEQFDIPHDRGSHHGQSRMIRLAYFEHPDYVPLLLRAYELWAELETVARQKLLHITGGLYVGPPNSKLVGGALESCRQHNLSHEILTRPEISARFGEICPPDDFTALYEDLAGFLLPQAVVAAHAEQALIHGATLHGRETVTDWTADDSGVTVSTNRETYHAGHVVLTAGAWSSKLLAAWRTQLKTTRQVLAWFAPLRREPFTLGSFPVWFMECLAGDGHYGFPILPGTPGIKVALHAPGDATDPDTELREITSADIDKLKTFLEQHMPNAAGPLLSASVCFYTYSPDSHFIVDRHPNFENVSMACGFSGHGFKFSSVIGEVLADMATDGVARHPIDFLRLARFA